MIGKILPQLGIVTALSTLSFVSLVVNPAQAAVITYEFSTITFGDNSLKGRFSYDEAAVFPVENETRMTQVKAEDIFDFSFDYIGETFTKNDVQFNNPGLLLIDGSLSNNLDITSGGLYFSLIDEDRQPISFSIRGGESTNAFEGDDFLFPVTYTKLETPKSVTEPGIMAGLAVVGLGVLMKKKLVSW